MNITKLKKISLIGDGVQVDVIYCMNYMNHTPLTAYGIYL